MQVEKLYEVALDIQADFRKTKMLEFFQGLINALQNQINAPNADSQKKTQEARDELLNALEMSSINSYSVSWKKILDEMNLSNYLGSNLANWVRQIFSKNQITQNEALSELTEIKQELDKTVLTVKNLCSSLSYLEFLPATLNPYEFEISVLIPREAIHNELGRLGKELKKIETIFLTFSEMVTGSRAPFQLKSISTTDPTVCIDSIPEVAAAIAIAIERTVALYNNILDLMIKHKELKDKSIPDDVLLGLKNYIDKSIKEGLVSITDELKNKYFKNVDETRKNHLEQELQRALEDIATRLDDGYGFDVRGEAKEVKEINENGEEKTVTIEDENYKIVTESRSKIRFFAAQPEKILSLPRPIDDDENEAPKSKGKK